MEGSVEKHGGVAFDVILKPATGEVPAVLSGSPTRERPLSLQDIEKKLKEAEDRRLAVEASKLQPVAKDMERLHEVNQKVHEMTETFIKDTEKRLSEKMETSIEIKNAQLSAMQERLKEHDRHVDEVREKKLTLSDENNCEADM